MITPTITDTFGTRLAARRNELGLSLRALAIKIGVSHAAISRWEHDLDLPSGSHLRRLATALNLATSTVGGWLDHSPLATPHIPTETGARAKSVTVRLQIAA